MNWRWDAWFPAAGKGEEEEEEVEEEEEEARLDAEEEKIKGNETGEGADEIELSL